MVVFFVLFHRGCHSMDEWEKYAHFGDRYSQFVYIELWSKMMESCEWLYNA